MQTVRRNNRGYSKCILVQTIKNGSLPTECLGLCAVIFGLWDMIPSVRIACPEGNTLEDTILLQISKSEGRILLTRDRRAANRAGVTGILISSDDVIEQVKQLVNLELSILS